MDTIKAPEHNLQLTVNGWYLDDGSIASADKDTLLRLLPLLVTEGSKLGLILNTAKTLIWSLKEMRGTVDMRAYQPFLLYATPCNTPAIKTLGAPLGTPEGYLLSC